MGKKEAFLSSEEMKVGSSLDAMETLIKKHEDFEKSLQAQVYFLCKKLRHHFLYCL